MDYFFMVFVERPDRSTYNAAPTKRWVDLADAKREAERLALKERLPVFVVEAISMVQVEPPPLRWTNLEDHRQATP